MPIAVLEQDANFANDPTGENILFTTKAVLSDHKGQDVADMFAAGSQEPVEDSHIYHG